MQRAFYSLCKKDPLEFRRYTPAETYLMLDVAKDEFEFKRVLRAQLLMTISNAPHFTKENKNPATLEEFLGEKKEMTPEEIEASWWNSAE
jgi:hypothetical protein